MAGTTGLEPATSAVTGQRSNQLSYVPKKFYNHLDLCHIESGVFLISPASTCSLPSTQSHAFIRALNRLNATSLILSEYFP